MVTTDNQRELFIVVDRNDRILGYRSRYACHHDKRLIHRGVNLIIYNDRGEMLLQQRSKTKDSDPGLWANAVGGHVTKGENYKETMHRETKEELGVDVRFKLLEKFIFHFPKQTEMEALFIATTNGPFRMNKEEVSRIEFFSKAQLKKRVASKEIQLTSLALCILEKVKFI